MHAIWLKRLIGCLNQKLIIALHSFFPPLFLSYIFPSTNIQFMEFTKRNYNSCMNVNERVSVRVVIVLNEIRNGSPRAKKGELNVAIEKKRAATVAVAISK